MESDVPSKVLVETGIKDKKLTEIRPKPDNIPGVLKKEPTKLWPVKICPKPSPVGQNTLITNPYLKLTNNKLVSIKLNNAQGKTPTIIETPGTTIPSLVTRNVPVSVPSLSYINNLVSTSVTTNTTEIVNNTITTTAPSSNFHYSLTPVSLKHLPAEVKQILYTNKSKIVSKDLSNPNIIIKRKASTMLSSQSQQQQPQKIKFATLPRLVPFHTTTSTTNSVTLTSSSVSKIMVAAQQTKKTSLTTSVDDDNSTENMELPTTTSQLKDSKDDIGEEEIKTPESTATASTTGRINIQISNGILSDPDGPIKMMSICDGINKDKVLNDNCVKKLKKLILSPRMAARSKSFQQSVLKKKDSENGGICRRRLSMPININGNNDEEEEMNEDEKDEVKKDHKLQKNQIKGENQKKGTNKKIHLNDFVNPLYCNENLDNISEENKSIEDSMSSKISTDSSIQQIETDDKLIATTLFPIEDDPIDLIKWSNGIGYLKNCNLHFQFNEYGLLEIMNKNEYKKLKSYDPNKKYDRPLHERDIDKRDCKNLTDNKETQIYYCQMCLCNGLAADFLTPDYCSTVCQNNTSKQNYNRRSIMSVKPKLSPTKKSKFLDDDKRIEIPVILNEFFQWEKYLSADGGYIAPKKLFPITNTSGSRFKIGMKLEAIDPENSSCFCVCTIVDQQTFRLKLHFDGYPSDYDFWVNADSPDLFPPNFCANTGRTLRVPPKYFNNFNWDFYLIVESGTKAPRHCFINHVFSQKNSFKTGMKLEADDLKNSGKVCVATVRDVIGDRILIHFDGWDDIYDYWTSISSPFIHPIDWHKSSGVFLTLPPGIPGNFSWTLYLQTTKSYAAPSSIFLPREPVGFKLGMKLEIVDKKVPQLIRPATVVAIDEYEIKVAFDGWPETYSYWVEDDSPNIFPVHWCSRTLHLLEFPANYGPKYRNLCGINGCRGLGNAINYNDPYHYSLQECPYEKKNFIKAKKLINRFDLPINCKEDLGETSRLLKNDKKRKVEPEINNIQMRIKKIKRSPSDTENKNEYIVDLDNSNIINNETKTATSSIITLNNNKELLIINQTKEYKDRLKVTSNLLNDYGPRLHQTYHLWKTNSRILRRNSNQINPLLWTTEHVYDYISKLPNCSDIAIKFKTDKIDGRALLSLQQNDMLKYMNIKLGPAIKIYNQIVQLREDVTINFLRT